jgi:predicted acyl esterase
MIDEKDVMIPTRHGLRVAARVYRPDGTGPFPALYGASPYRYDNDEAPPTSLFPYQETGPIRWYVEQHGYAYVHADVVGTGRSDGDFRLLDRREQEANYDVIEWVAAQRWSNGKVGGIGQSYYCMSQWLMATQNPPHLACIGAYDGLVDPYFYFAFPGGIESFYLPYLYTASIWPPNLWPANGAQSRYIAPDIIAEALRHPLYDDFWRERSAIEMLEQIRVPVFSVGAWSKHQLHCSGNILGFLRSSGPKKLFVTGTQSVATAHTDFATIDFHQTYFLPFYDHYLKGLRTSFLDRPPVEVAVRNAGTTLTSDTWPPTGIEEIRFYLAAGPSGAVDSLNDGRLSHEPSGPGSTSYSYPDPQWSIGLGTSILDSHGLNHTARVLTFTSEPLESNLDLVGNCKLVLFVASTEVDTDFIVKLSDQQSHTADGRPAAVIVTRGWFRASHRRKKTPDEPLHTQDHSVTIPLEPGEIYGFEISLEPMAYRFNRNSRIRVEIANHDSPVADRQFAHIYRASKRGTDTIFHSGEHPSHLVLQVMPST